ncbi:MAG: hypothetical protein JNK64_02755, partial [Myxococcales bacterium]|nr:hypothetical protein [Myxococcales bacterium]
MIARVALAFVAATAATAATAAAQAAPPAPPDDPERAAEARSAFWDEVAHPGTRARHEQIADAIRALRLTSTDLSAVERGLTQLTAATPASADAWGYLAVTAERRRRWAVCADAYARAYALAPGWRAEALIDVRTPPKSPLLRAPTLSVALCASRAGAYAAARAAIERAIALGESSSELWLRAGEVALAEGRLTDAIDALGRSTDPTAAWLRATALDRARRDAEAEAAAERANRDDPYAARTTSGVIPLAPPYDADYVMALAARQRGQWSFVVAYLRRYLAAAPADDRFRARAAEHLAIAERAAVTEAPAVQASDGDAASSAALTARVVAARPRLEACLRAVPTGLAELRITMAAPPRAPRPPRA